MDKSGEEWGKKLPPEKYHVLREKGTESAFTGEYYDNKREGVYRCGACGRVLFSSGDKYDSGTGWPSFTRPVEDDAVETRPDDSFMMKRTEVVCPVCGSHLGHVFDDGPKPTGKRYCINSLALDFQEE